MFLAFLLRGEAQAVVEDREDTLRRETLIHAPDLFKILFEEKKEEVDVTHLFPQSPEEAAAFMEEIRQSAHSWAEVQPTEGDTAPN